MSAGVKSRRVATVAICLAVLWQKNHFSWFEIWEQLKKKKKKKKRKPIRLVNEETSEKIFVFETDRNAPQKGILILLNCNQTSSERRKRAEKTTTETTA